MMNEKTCLLDATVHVLCLDLFRNPDIPESAHKFQSDFSRNYLIQAIGHDGTERGFHSQEIQDALRLMGYYMQRHELFPCLQLHLTRKWTHCVSESSRSTGGKSVRTSSYPRSTITTVSLFVGGQWCPPCVRLPGW